MAADGRSRITPAAFLITTQNDLSRDQPMLTPTCKKSLTVYIDCRPDITDYPALRAFAISA
jgi:hypothetical protein